MIGLPWLLIAITVSSWANRFASSSMLSKEYSLLYQPPANRTASSSFAFTVALLPGAKGTSNSSLLLVSDPSADNGTGKVFYGKIPANRSKTLQSLRFTDSDAITVPLDSKSFEPEVRSVMRFGASIAAVQYRGVVICAPGYNTKTSFNLTAARGLCAVFNTTNSMTGSPEWLTNFFTDNEPTTADHKDEALCLGGFSTVLLNDSVATSGPFCSRSGLSVQGYTEGATKISPPYLTGHMYTGFSVSADNDNSVYATQPPTSKEERTVYIRRIYSGRFYERQAEGEFQNLRTSSFGYMGYSSAVLHKFKKIPQYLVLGSPYQSDLVKFNSTDTGCVWLINLQSQSSIKETPLHYCSTEQGGRFGTSIVSIGDLNNDNLEDFVVGCPGCGKSSSGAVYVFLTPMESNFQLKPYQIFNGNELKTSITGFGYSLAAGDVDGDLVPDLAVGSVSSGYTAVMLSKYVSNVEVTTTGVKTSIDLSLHDLIGTPNRKYTLIITINNINDYVFKKKSPSPSNPSKFVKTYKEKPVNLIVLGNLSELIDTNAAAKLNITLFNVTNTDGWYRLGTVVVDSTNVQLEVPIEISVLKNANGHLSQYFMPRENFLRMQLRFISNETRMAYSYNYQACPNNTCDVQCKLFNLKKLSMNLKNDLALKLISPSMLIIDERRPIMVQLLVSKQSGLFYGGAAIKVTLSDGVSDDIGIKCNLTQKCQYKRNDENKFIIISHPMTEYDDGLLSASQKHFSLNVTFNINKDKLKYTIGFELMSLAQQSDQDEGVATLDEDLSNNQAKVQINMQSSMVLHLYIKHAEENTIDLRTSSRSQTLQSLKGRVSGSTIGPELKQIYAITAISKPSNILKNIELDVQVPFLFGEQLLTYFSRKMRFGSRGQHEVPGQPYVSRFENGSFPSGDPTSSLCQPVEEDLAKRLFTPDVSLLEGQHKIMEHSNATDDGDSIDTTGGSLQRRSRRSSDRPVEAASMADSTQRHRLAYMQSLNCRQPNNIRCITFRCSFSLDTSSNRISKAYLHLHSRLWSPTFFNQQLNVFEFTTNVHLKHEPDAIFRTANITEYANCTQTFLFKGIQMKPEPFPWGYVILGIFIGLWLLLLFILLLWYCNFFKRRRPDYTAVKQQACDDDDDHFYT